VPVRILFDEIPAENQPNSRTVEFSHAWSGDTSNPSFVADVVERWRRQRR
jgi:hypothetical protein